jgi:hypothetical protein
MADLNHRHADFQSSGTKFFAFKDLNYPLKRLNKFRFRNLEENSGFLKVGVVLCQPVRETF